MTTLRKVASQSSEDIDQEIKRISSRVSLSTRFFQAGKGFQSLATALFNSTLTALFFAGDDTEEPESVSVRKWYVLAAATLNLAATGVTFWRTRAQAMMRRDRDNAINEFLKKLKQQDIKIIEEKKRCSCCPKSKCSCKNCGTGTIKVVVAGSNVFSTISSTINTGFFVYKFIDFIVELCRQDPEGLGAIIAQATGITYISTASLLSFISSTIRKSKNNTRDIIDAIHNGCEIDKNKLKTLAVLVLTSVSNGIFAYFSSDKSLSKISRLTRADKDTTIIPTLITTLMWISGINAIVNGATSNSGQIHQFFVKKTSQITCYNNKVMFANLIESFFNYTTSIASTSIFFHNVFHTDLYNYYILSFSGIILAPLQALTAYAFTKDLYIETLRDEEAFVAGINAEMKQSLLSQRMQAENKIDEEDDEELAAGDRKRNQSINYVPPTVILDTEMPAESTLPRTESSINSSDIVISFTNDRQPATILSTGKIITLSTPEIKSEREKPKKPAMNGHHVQQKKPTRVIGRLRSTQPITVAVEKTPPAHHSNYVSLFSSAASVTQPIFTGSKCGIL